MFIYGDFNIDLLNFDTCALTQDFVNMLSSYLILPQILQPTRITDHTATLIDNIFISCSEHAVISGNIVHDITDHFPNFLILNKLSFSFSKQEMHKRDYSRLDESDLLRDVQSVNWHHIFQPEDNFNNVFSSFHSHISSIIDKHAPVRKMSKTEIKTRRRPWITPGLKKSITTKNKLFHKYINNKSDFNHRQFKLYRNKHKHLIDISKSNIIVNILRRM